MNHLLPVACTPTTPGLHRSYRYRGTVKKGPGSNKVGTINGIRSKRPGSNMVVTGKELRSQRIDTRGGPILE
jgi:hypothetical protein